MLAEMLKQLERAPEAPAPIVSLLRAYKHVAWKALNSYSHAGIHPLARSLTGYPFQLTCDAVRNSNAVVALAAQLAAILTGDAGNMAPVGAMHEEFEDCLPIRP
jgi:hypothetical protein